MPLALVADMATSLKTLGQRAEVLRLMCRANPLESRSVRNGSKKNWTPPCLVAARDSYRHPTADSPMWPEVCAQAQFKKRKAPETYHYDTSLDPDLNWDGQKGATRLNDSPARVENRNTR